MSVWWLNILQSRSKSTILHTWMDKTEPAAGFSGLFTQRHDTSCLLTRTTQFTWPRSCCDKHGDHMATRHSPPTLPKQSGKASRIQTQSTLVRVLANVGYVGWCLNTRGYETDTGKTSFHVHESMPSRMLLFRCMLWLLWLLNRRCWTGSDQAVPVTLRSTSILQADFSSKPTRTP